MAEAPVVHGNKTFFDDVRTPMRRMAVSSHPELGIVVLSLWEADRCRATFRLPVDDAPRLMAALAEAFDAEPEPLRRIK